MMMSSASTWARAAISGTTPPNAACSSICDSTTLERIVPRPSSLPLDQRRRGFVAGRLDAEHDHVASRGSRFAFSAGAVVLRMPPSIDSVSSPPPQAGEGAEKPFVHAN